ncbi:hypothetical protein DhcVS_401 [Dehalococcoides mccartyi VS]|uniref:Uncharacterized protein n=1 Tax=Dehalococcoides mccartyi (strain VS) TaxID=311424 RepID=D2BGV7_DEHMV|nr:hypothetical protein DhcVS_401 [Dehalococcoides mccartyi VS]
MIYNTNLFVHNRKSLNKDKMSVTTRNAGVKRRKIYRRLEKNSSKRPIQAMAAPQTIPYASCFTSRKLTPPRRSPPNITIIPKYCKRYDTWLRGGALGATRTGLGLASSVVSDFLPSLPNLLTAQTTAIKPPIKSISIGPILIMLPQVQNQILSI